MKSAITIQPPIVNDPIEAMSDLGCSLERLIALFRSNTNDLRDQVLGAMSSGHLERRAFEITMIFDLAIEKLDEVYQTTNAIDEALHAERRATQRKAA